MLLGPPLPSHLERQERLSNPMALAILSSDALSSVAYATEEMLRVLLPVAGVAACVHARHVEVDADETSAILDEWARSDLGIEPEIVPAPYREPGGPVKARVEELRRGTHAVVSVVVPSLALRWWQRLLYTNSTRALRTALAGTGTTALIECRLPLAIAEPVPERIRSSPR